METVGNITNTNFVTPMGIVSRTQDEDFTFLIRDVHGDVVETFTNGIKDTYSYDAFGNEKTPDTNDDNPLRYCGEYYDTESGLIYLRNRYYDPELGRFINEDPIQDGLNWYVYCANNPLMFTDPLGLKGKGEVFGIGGGTYEDVRRVQEFLNKQGYVGADGEPLVEDGLFGENTLYAIKEYQSNNNLTVDGLVGDETWSCMGFEFDNKDNIILSKKAKPNFTSKKDQGNSRKGSEDRQKTGARERNVGHKEGEEHSRVPKGNNGGFNRISTENTAEAVGWATAGTILYMIISEGSRLIPIRNLIPIP